MRRSALLISFLWLFALTLVGWTLWQLPLTEVANSINELSLPQWTLWLMLNALIILVLGLRWQILTRALDSPVNFWKLLLIRQAGQTISFITPGPQFGGEPLQIYWLFRHGLPLRKALLSLGLDRFFELWVNFSVLMLAVCLLLLGVGNNNNAVLNGQNVAIDLQTAVLPLLFFLGLMFALAWILISQPRWLTDRLERVAMRWKDNLRLRNIGQHWQSLGSDLRFALRTQKLRFLVAILLSLLGWVGLLAELHLVLQFVGIETDVYDFLIILLAMRMALLLPMPGGVGTLEASVLWSFHTLGLPPSAALGVIALMRARDAIILLIGFACLRASNSSRALIKTHAGN